ncbi:VOC family protein [Phaeobacter italicus]|jgi:catechol 2,3-dioxygenase-like lactoylglutathione lyase family enzyme|uniref:VOC family protein n=1 Tax=Phaeobacter italicus TaxID=481446 RepID=UPI002FDB9660
MIAYITIGSNDLPRAKAFYQAILPPLGYDFSEGREGLSFVLPVPEGEQPCAPDVYVKRPFDGAPATAGNGMMVAFQARTQAEVRDLHGAALAAGGQDDGAPGFRAAYSAGFYVGYLRDPDGNKIALFSSNPDEPSRDD